MPEQSDPVDDEHYLSSPERHSGLPGWVKVTIIVVAVLVAVVVIANLTGVAGEHGPSRH